MPDTGPDTETGHSAAAALSRLAWSKRRDRMLENARAAAARGRETQRQRAIERRARADAEARLKPTPHQDRRVWASPLEYDPARHRIHGATKRIYNWIAASADTGVTRGQLALLIEQHLQPWNTRQLLSQSLYKLRKLDLIQESL